MSDVKPDRIIQTTPNQSAAERPTIAYMAAEVAVGNTSMKLWSGVAAGAQEHDLNLIAIVGGNITVAQANIVYDLVTPEICTGIVNWTISRDFSDEELVTMHARYQPLPMVTILRKVPGHPMVNSDDYPGMQEAVTHLIETHGCRRLAFIRAREDHNPLAEERYRAYQETLEQYDIPFDPALVTPEWDWANESGERAVTLFLDERGLRPGQDIDAIVSTSDLMVMGTLKALQNRNIRIPEDLALVGFNDSVEAQVAIPSVTSVASHLPEQGRQAVSVLKDLLEQAPAPEQVLIPTRLAVHQSCGCLDETVVQAAAFSPPGAKKAGRRATFAARRKDVLQAMLEAVGILGESEEAAWADKLLQAFVANLDAPESGEFLSVLRQTLQHVALARRDVPAWQDALSAIQHHIGLCRDPHQAFLLLGQARTMVGKIASQDLAQQQLQDEHHAEQLRLLNQKLLTTFDVTQLTNVLTDGMRPLGIPGCYLALYEDPQPYEYPQPAPAWSRLILAYDEDRQIPLEPGGARFPTHQILPEGMWPEDRRYTMILQALYFQDLQIGFVLFEVGSQNWPMYDVLRAQISSALKGALLMQQEERRSRQLQTVAQVGTAVSSLLDTSELLQQVVDLTKSSFNLYHAHIYLLDERGESLVPVAGAGEVGRQMAAERWQIPVDSEQSLVARAARNREGLMVNNVLEDPAWQSNPLLPDTRSELAVPLLVGDEVLGVLDVQADKAGYFIEEDIRVQSTLAAQIATALNNARLFGQIKEANAMAQKADRLKTRLLANVSHELRTPLNVILGYTQAGLDAPQQKERRSAALSVKELQHIDNNAHHLLRVINDLLDLSRAEIDELDLHLELIDSRQLLAETFHNIVDTTSANDIKWTLALPARLPAIQADRVRLRQVLLNLLSNAAKFTQAGEIILGADVTPPYLHVWVQDTGVGIDVELQERIFEPFVTGQTPSGQAEGIGLGLSITHRLVTMHRGSMMVESQVDEGATFHVYLPLPNLSNRPAAFVASTEPVLLLLSARKEPPAEIVEFCERQGLGIHRLGVGQDLETVLAQEQPAVLAWDLAHANPGDWQLVERLRQDTRCSQLPFILYNQPQDDTAGLEVGLTNFVIKPVTGNTLLEAINASKPGQAVGPILVVDDDALTRELYQDMISKGLPGYLVLTAENGVVALELMAQETPSLVILDLIMPEMDGFDMLDQMRGNPQLSQIPVIILSGRVLTLDDINRIEQHKLVTLQSKGILSEAETITFLNQTLFGTATLPQHTQALVKRTVAYLQQNYDRRLVRWEIAEVVGVSENYLSRVFRQELGLSPWEYLNRYRVVKAQELLRHTDHSIKAVALQTGFKDRTYFSRVFKKVTGMSPAAYRESSE